MSKEMVISATPHETRVAILEEGQLCEIYVEREKEFALVGSIYKGRVTRVLPGMQSSFVDIGLDSDAFLYVTDFLEEIEDLDHVVTTVEDKEHKIEDQGGQVFTTDAAGHTAALEPTDVDPTNVEPANFQAANAEPASAEPRTLEPSRALPELLPGESIEDAQPRANSQSPLSRPPQQFSAPRHDSRPPRRFEGRGRDNRGGFGRGGGRGRGGRDNRGGGRPGGRFGRDLPHSKYASHRPYEPETETPGGAPPGNFVPVLLPGETLSRFKDAPLNPDATSAPATIDSPETQAPLTQDASTIEQELVAPPAQDPVIDPVQQHERAPRFPEQRFATHAGGALDALPGETLRRAEPPPPPPPPPAAEEEREVSHHDEFDRLASRAIEDSSVPLTEDVPAEERETEEIAAVEVPSDLTEEEAAALREHVAEAQLEEAEREEREDREAAEEAHDENGSTAELSAADSTEEYSAGEEHSEESSETEFAAGEHESSEEESTGDADSSATASERYEPAHDAPISGAPEPGAAPDAIVALEGERVSGGGGGSGQPQIWRGASVRGNFRARMQHPARRGGGGRDRGRGRDRGPIAVRIAAVNAAPIVDPIAPPVIVDAARITVTAAAIASNRAARNSSPISSSKARRSSFKSPKSRSAKKARASPATSPFPDASSFTCPLSTTPASRAKSPRPKSARAFAIWSPKPREISAAASSFAPPRQPPLPMKCAPTSNSSPTPGRK